jgi:hypothetical protein
MYPSHQLSIRLLIRRLNALGYEVAILPTDIEWVLVPRKNWGFAITIAGGDNIDNTLLFIIPLLCRHHLLTCSGAFFGNYKD